MTAILAVLMVILTIRHTRSDEESGRLELLGGGRLGRDAPLAPGGLPATGSLALGLGWAATGMAFSAVAGLAAQLTASARAATGYSISVVAVTYALRAVGDLAEPGPSVLSWLSPIGWNQQIRAFAGDRWWVLVLPISLSLALVPAAFVLRARRDLGAGLRAERPGPAAGSLFGVWDLAVRLQYRVLAAAYGVSSANHLRSEEAAGHTEALLGTATARVRRRFRRQRRRRCGPQHRGRPGADPRCLGGDQRGAGGVWLGAAAGRGGLGSPAGPRRPGGIRGAVERPRMADGPLPVPALPAAPGGPG